MKSTYIGFIQTGLVHNTYIAYSIFHSIIPVIIRQKQKPVQNFKYIKYWKFYEAGTGQKLFWRILFSDSTFITSVAVTLTHTHHRMMFDDIKIQST